jgi:ATP/maltotriose-dependent transcriptional regulator MalT
MGRYPLAAQAKMSLGIVALRENEPSTAVEHCQAGLELLEDEPLPMTVRVTAGLAQATAVAGDYDRALELLEEAQDTLDTVEDAKIELDVATAAIVVHRERGAFEAAREAAETVQEKGEDVGDLHATLEGLIELARTEQEAGNDEQARTILNEVRDRATNHAHWLKECDQIETSLQSD